MIVRRGFILRVQGPRVHDIAKYYTWSIIVWPIGDL